MKSKVFRFNKLVVLQIWKMVQLNVKLYKYPLK